MWYGCFLSHGGTHLFHLKFSVRICHEILTIQPAWGIPSPFMETTYIYGKCWLISAGWFPYFLISRIEIRHDDPHGPAWPYHVVSTLKVLENIRHVVQLVWYYDWVDCINCDCSVAQDILDSNWVVWTDYKLKGSLALHVETMPIHTGFPIGSSYWYPNRPPCLQKNVWDCVKNQGKNPIIWWVIIMFLI